MRKTPLVLFLAMLANPAGAEFFPPKPEIAFSVLSKQFEEAASALDEPAGISARKIASTWFYLGPCEGNTKELRSANDPSVFQVVQTIRPGTPEGIAILQMIAILQRTNIVGRNPLEQTCKFALAMANSN